MKIENGMCKQKYEKATLILLEAEDVLHTSGESTPTDPGIDLPLDPFDPVTKP